MRSQGKQIHGPTFIKPMVAKLAAHLPEGPEWLYEIKWDGYRTEAIKIGEHVRLLSRSAKELSADFPGVIEAVRRIKAASAIVDGEVIAVDGEGRASFQLLQNRSARNRPRIVYYAFDLLWLDGRDLRTEPLEKRKEILERVIAKSGVLFSASLPGDASVIVEHARKFSLEGIVAKRRTSVYEAGKRSGAWTKVQLKRQQEFVIGGYIPEGKSLRSIAVGYYEGGELVFAGKVRAGFSRFNRAELAGKLRAIETKDCPFPELRFGKPGRWGEGLTQEDIAEIHWVKPAPGAQVRFTEWTSGGNLRHAEYLGLRSDKHAKHVIREDV